MDFQGRLTTRRSGNQDLINSERFPMIKKISNDHMVVTFPSTRNNILSMTGKMSRTHTLMQELNHFGWTCLLIYNNQDQCHII